MGEAKASRGPIHSFGPYGPTSKSVGHPVLFGFSPSLPFDSFPNGGGYPHGFLPRAYKIMGVTNPSEVLHVCSGSMRLGITVDIRPETRPTVVADGQRLPFRDGVFRWVMIDPPYTRQYARNLYNTRYPVPKRLVYEAARVTAPGGTVGFLHFMVPMIPKRLLLIVGVWGITQGSGYQIRAFTVMKRNDPSLPLETA